MRKKKNAMLVSAVAAAFCAGAAVVEPKNTDEVLTNPGMGICHFYYSSRIWAYGAQQEPGDTLDWMPGHSVIYMRLPWCYLEPEEGVFRWDIIDSKIAPWLKAGKKVAFRISCQDHTIVSTPKWVLDKGVKGYMYHYMDKPENALIFEPKWDDPILLAEHEKFLKAFAKRFDGNPDVAFVDLGSFGLYGEGHSPELAKLRNGHPEEFDRICKIHLDMLRQCLPNTQLVISDDIGGAGWIVAGNGAIAADPNHFEPKGSPRLYDHPILAYARALGYGLRDDSIMCNPSKPWASDHFGRIFARERPVVIETGHITKRFETESWKPENLRKCIEDYHASYISTHGFPDLYWKTNKHVWKDFANRLGYRFELRKVEYPDTVKVSERVTVKSTWVNVGVAPEYANSSLTWNLLNEKGVVCWSVTDPTFGFRSLEPKWEGVENPVTIESPCTFGYAAEIPDNGNDQILNYCKREHVNDPGTTCVLLKPGVYTLAVSVGTNYGKPEIALPLEGGVDRIYPIGNLSVRCVDGK